MNRIEFGDCRDTMRRWAADGVKVQTCVTSPPYFGLRDYGHDGQIGLEQTPEQYIAAIVEVFQCVKDVLADDGTLWLNIDDSYGKNKQLLGIPWRVAFALQSVGWILRQDIIWSKTNPKPEPMWGRCARSHEYLFLFAKSTVYHFDGDAIRGDINEAAAPQLLSERKTRKTAKDSARYQMAQSMYGENATQMSKPIGAMFSGYSKLKGPSKKSVWSVARASYSGAHMAVFPPALIEPCILAGSRHNDIVLDPFMGSGTTAQVALQHGRQYLGCELNPEYEALQQQRISQSAPIIDDSQLSLLDDLANPKD